MATDSDAAGTMPPKPYATDGLVFGALACLLPSTVIAECYPSTWYYHNVPSHNLSGFYYMGAQFRSKTEHP